MMMKNFALATLMTLAVTSAFASKTSTVKQGMMAPSMEDQDYSGWKESYLKWKMAPAGGGPVAAMTPDFKDEYDAKVYKWLKKSASDECSIPLRPFDMAFPIMSYDSYWMGVEKKLNTYRRELIREDEARGMALAKMTGRPMPAMSGM